MSIIWSPSFFSPAIKSPPPSRFSFLQFPFNLNLSLSRQSFACTSPPDGVCDVMHHPPPPPPTTTTRPLTHPERRCEWNVPPPTQSFPIPPRVIISCEFLFFSSSFYRFGIFDRLPQLRYRLVRHLHRFLHFDLSIACVCMSSSAARTKIGGSMRYM